MGKLINHFQTVVNVWLSVRQLPEITTQWRCFAKHMYSYLEDMGLWHLMSSCLLPLEHGDSVSELMQP